MEKIIKESVGEALQHAGEPTTITTELIELDRAPSIHTLPPPLRGEGYSMRGSQGEMDIPETM